MITFEIISISAGFAIIGGLQLYQDILSKWLKSFCEALVLFSRFLINMKSQQRTENLSARLWAIALFATPNLPYAIVILKLLCKKVFVTTMIFIFVLLNVLVCYPLICLVYLLKIWQYAEIFLEF